MIERPEDLHVFASSFTGSILVDGIKANAIFSKGSDQERTIRGTIISDSRSFLVGLIPWAKADSIVEAGDKSYQIDEIQEKAGLFSYYLTKHYNHEEDVNDESEDYPL